MIHRVLRQVAFVGFLVAMMACSVDMEPMEDISSLPPDDQYATTFGMLSEDRTLITTDDGVSLHIVEYGVQVTSEELESATERVMFNYTILGHCPQGGLYICLNRLYPLVVKDIVCFDAATQGFSVCSSSIPGGDFDNATPSLLVDPAMPYQASIGSGYINVNVCYRSPYDIDEDVPCVDLVYDIAASTEDTMIFQLVYAEGDFANVALSDISTRFQWFSFRIVEEMEPHVEGVNLYTFKWLWWLNETDPLAGVQEYSSILYPNTYGGESRIVELNRFQ